MANSRDARIDPSLDDAAKLVLRLILGVMMLFHGVSKITGGNGFVTGVLAKAGLPPELGYLVYVGEVLAPILLIVGAWTRPAAIVVAINMVVAVWLVGMGRLFSINQYGGYALEVEAMFLFTAIAVALLGAGRYSIGGVSGRWN
jgi:putative oxidoreductase